MIRLPVTIGGRMIALLLLLACVAMAGGGMTYRAAQRQAAATAALDRAAESRPLIERLRAGIYNVVMESRGLYLATDRKQAEVFARNLNRSLEDIRASFARLRDVVPEGHRAAVEAAVPPLEAFVTLRAELARVGVEQGREAADRIGNNAANRSARTAFSNSLDRLADELAVTLPAMQAGLAEQGRSGALRQLGATSVAVLAVLALAVWMVRTALARPVRQLTTAVDEQRRATHEIAQRVTGVAGMANRVGSAMDSLAASADNGSRVSRQVERAASAVNATAGNLSAEVDQFLVATRGTQGDRRGYERHPGHGLRVRLAAGDTQPRTAAVVDVSLGGTALRADPDGLRAGDEVAVLFPDGRPTLHGRVARLEGGEVAIAFRQNAETIADAEAFIALVGGTMAPALAA